MSNVKVGTLDLVTQAIKRFLRDCSGWPQSYATIAEEGSIYNKKNAIFFSNHF